MVFKSLYTFPFLLIEFAVLGLKKTTKRIFRTLKFSNRIKKSFSFDIERNRKTVFENSHIEKV
jgi:hypothetical protein